MPWEDENGTKMEHWNTNGTFIWYYFRLKSVTQKWHKNSANTDKDSVCATF